MSIRPIASGALLCLLVSVPASAFSARFGLSPDNGEALVAKTLASARSRLVINMYEFDNPAITAAVEDRIRAGVSTEILIEAEPFGGHLSPSSRVAAQALRSAMTASGNSADHLYFMQSPAAGASRRFRFDHAKYAVIDSKRALVSSNNFSGSGHPSAGRVGDRGWDVVLDDKPLSAQLEDLFSSDTNTSYGDIVEIGPNDLDGTPPAPAAPGNRERTNPALAQGSGSVRSATLVTSPDSLNGLEEAFRNARSHLEIEEMSLPLFWRDSTGPHTSALVEEILSAARRGVRVRVLLNDDDAFIPNPDPAREDPNKGNLETARYLLKMARCQHLRISARIAAVRELGLTIVHNKGMLADGQWAFVSSINGTRNSVMNNRETALLLQSRDAARYFGHAFEYDWKHSPDLPEDSSSCGSTP